MQLLTLHTRLKNGLVIGLLAVVFGVHAWLSLRLFPSWEALINDEPLISVDHSIHIYHGYLGARFLEEHGTAWGYDPYFMAGYPKTPVYDSSSGLAELFQLLAGGQYSPRAYKLGILLIIMLVPPAIALAAWAYRLSLASVVASTAWTWWFWWSGFADTLTRTGLVAFVWSATLAVLVPALFYRWVERPSRWNWFMLTAAAALGIQSHSTFPIMTAVPIGFGYIWAVLRTKADAANAHVRTIRWHLATWLALSAALLVTSFWWWPLIKFLPLKTASDLFMTHRGDPRESLVERIAGLLLGYYLLSDARIPLLLVYFGMAGLAHWFFSGEKLRGWMAGSQIIFFGLLTFCGSEWRVTRNLEPLRFQVPLGLALCTAAGAAIPFLTSHLAVRLQSDARTWARAAASALTLGFAILLTFPAAWWTAIRLNPAMRPPATWPSSLERIRSARPMAVGLRPEMTQLVHWINQNTDNSARILFEDQLRLLEAQDPGAPESLHWTPLLPILTERQFVGGLYHLAFIPHARASFGDWSLAGRNIRHWPIQELWNFLEQYNIGWVITWSRASPDKQGADRLMPLSTDTFARLEFCELVARLPRHTQRPDESEYSVFRVKREPNYFALGAGRVVRADYNRIELEQLEPQRGEIVLRYHWQDGMVVETPGEARHDITLHRADQAGDPVGFIRIVTPRSIDRMTIVNSYR